MTGIFSHRAAVARIVAAVAIALVAMALAPLPAAGSTNPRGVICEDGTYVRSASQCSEPDTTTTSNPDYVEGGNLPQFLVHVVCADGTTQLSGQCNVNTDFACADGSYVAPGGSCPKGDTRVYEWCPDSHEYIPPGQRCAPLPTPPTSQYKSCPWNDGDPNTDNDEIIVFADERCPPRPRAADFEPPSQRAADCGQPPNNSASTPETPKLVGTGENGKITDRDRAAYDAKLRPGGPYDRAWNAAIRAHEAEWRAYDRCRGLSFD